MRGIRSHLDLTCYKTDNTGSSHVQSQKMFHKISIGETIVDQVEINLPSMGFDLGMVMDVYSFKSF